ncbi:MAG: response regulator [Magnetococcales bacterium]|nr:response regulator [Magnetococcales bacterium]
MWPKSDMNALFWIRHLFQDGKGSTYLTLILVFMLTSSSVGGVIVGVIYQTFLQEQETVLLDMVRSHSRFVEHLAMDEAKFHGKDSPEYRTFMDEVLNSYRKFIPGVTGEFIMGRMKRTQIEFLFAEHSQYVHKPDSVSGPLATPMQLALSGKSGASKGHDDRGEQVLAIYVPLNHLGWGLVFKKDMGELRQPFIQAAWFAAALGVPVIILGWMLFHRVSNPLFRRLTLSEKKYHSIFEFSSHGIILVDPVTGAFLDVNPMAAQFLGYFREELLQRSLADIDAGGMGNQNPSLLDQIMRSGGAPFESTLRCRDNTLLPVEISARKFLLNDRQVFQLLVRDVGEYKRVEAELQQYREHLEEMVRQRTEALETARDAAEEGARAKESFLVNMSHEIRTPMNGVLGMAELALKTSLTQKQRHYIDTIYRSGRVLLRIINDVLDLSKIHAGHMSLEIQMFDLGVLVRDVTDILAHRVRDKGLEFGVYMDPETPVHLLGDPYRLSQILFNLLGNAIKFTKQGSVALWVDVVENQEAYVQLRFQVIDTGIGISEEFQQRLFQAFSQQDSSVARRFGGTGLGLAISRHLLQLMDGNLEVESVPDQGTKFWFLVRFGKQRPGNQQELTSWQDVRKSGLRSNATFKGNVLLVEDNWVNQEVATATLESLGCRVTAVEDGQQALAQVCTDDATFDVVFMDLEMSGLDGMETTRRIRQWEQQRNIGPIPIIAVTAHAMTEVRQRCLASGMDDYLCKPFSLGDMRLLLGRWLPQEEEGVPETVVSAESLLAVSAEDDISHLNRPLEENAGADQSVSSVLDPEALGHILELNRKADNTLLEKMVTHYFAQTPKLLRQLEQSLECRNSEGVRVAAHTIKSSSLVMGVRHLAELGRIVEADYANLESVAQHFTEMMPAFEEAKQVLRDFLHTQSKGG